MVSAGLLISGVISGAQGAESHTDSRVGFIQVPKLGSGAASGPLLLGLLVGGVCVGAGNRRLGLTIIATSLKPSGPLFYQISYKGFISAVTHHALLFPPPHTADQIVFRFLALASPLHLCFSCDLHVGEMGSFPALVC